MLENKYIETIIVFVRSFHFSIPPPFSGIRIKMGHRTCKPYLLKT
jgi:hypothetical protein